MKNILVPFLEPTYVPLFQHFCPSLVHCQVDTYVGVRTICNFCSLVVLMCVPNILQMSVNNEGMPTVNAGSKHQ